MTNHGLFIGLITVDLIYLAASAPQNNQKLVASDYTVAAGGPATNAAVTFSYLGNQATLLGVLGSHPMTQLIRGDLTQYHIGIVDLDPSVNTPPPVSSIIVTQSTGERAVISLNAVKTPASVAAIPANILHNIDVVLIDGHQMPVGYAIAQMAKAHHIPIIIDGGSWKPGFQEVLPLVDYAICSANFRPPDCNSETEVIDYLRGLGIPHIAITHGEQPITYCSHGKIGAIAVPSIQPVDTLGAGDIFHGAFCHYILQASFTDALDQAAKIAAKACQYFGTRRWMDERSE
ncbi:sugar kinase [Anabaena sp. 4-3]|uniref:sugar kinase n=1 Tax=Anabaena sp. 4-3 TaxID=1811979 RepID=UPI00082D5C9A|nr:sugar kinase [Anabaena sp. 4-3]